jgi:tRNA-2-methylthio-N6-dimethylallyladenosine synthase
VNQRQIGRRVEVLVATGEGRKDSATHRLSGRAEDSRLVHFEVPEGAETPRPGDIVTVEITEAKPFYLLADATATTPYEVRRTRAGEAWDNQDAASCAVPTQGSDSGVAATGAKVSLGLPTLRVATTPIYDPADGQR